MAARVDQKIGFKDWDSLTNIELSIQESSYVEVSGKRFFKIAGHDIPLDKVVFQIFHLRPLLHNVRDSDQVKRYFNIVSRFKLMLPENREEKSIYQKVWDTALWYCTPMTSLCCFCTRAGRESVLLTDAKMGLEGYGKWERLMINRLNDGGGM